MIQNGLISFLLAAFVLAGFLASLMPLAQHEAAWFAAAFFITAAGTLFALAAAPVLRRPRTPLAAVAGAFWLLALISVFLSEAPYISFVYFCFFSVFPLTLLTAILAPDRDGFYRLAGWGLAFIIAGLSVSCLVQFFFFPAMLHKGSVHLPLADPNGMAGILSIGFVCGVSMMLAVQRRRLSSAALFFCMLVFAALLTTGSRAAFYLLLPALAILFVAAPAAVIRHRRCLLALAGGMAVLFAVLTLAAQGPVTPVTEILGFGGSAAPSMASRAGIWASTWQIIRQHFWSGTGIGTFFLYYPEVRDSDVTSSGLMAHNDPLQFWAEMGVGAPILFYAFIVLAVGRTVRALKPLGRNDMRRVHMLAPFCALGAMIVHAHLTFHFYVLPMLVLTGLLLGYWFDRTHIAAGEVSEPPFRPLPYFGIKAALVLPLMAAVLFFVCVQGGYILVAQGKAQIAAGNLEGYAASVNRADRLSRHTNDQAFVLAATVPLGVLEIHGKKNFPAEAQKLFAQGNEMLQKAEELNPRLAAVPYFRARLVRAAAPFIDPAQQKEAETFLQKALALDPLHLSSRMLLADIYEERNDDARALEVLKAGMKWRYGSQDPAAYYDELAWLALEQEDMKTHVAAMRLTQDLLHQKQRVQAENPMTGDFRDFLPGQ